jgi:signal transduction histidine kinase
MPKTTPPNTPLETVAVPFPRVTGLVRQLTHDVRNGLNNVDLQAAYLQELVGDAQVLPEIKRLRGMVTDAAKMLAAFSANFWLPKPHFITYSAGIFVEDFRQRLETMLPEQAPQIQWTVDLHDEAIPVDIDMFFRGLAEFFKNACQFREANRPIEVHVDAEDGMMVLKLVEGKSSVPSPPETWGHDPLISTRRGGFGMGLFYAHQVIALHGGEVAVTFDSAMEQLTTRVSLPLAVP